MNRTEDAMTCDICKTMNDMHDARFHALADRLSKVERLLEMRFHGWRTDVWNFEQLEAKLAEAEKRELKARDDANWWMKKCAEVEKERIRQALGTSQSVRMSVEEKCRQAELERDKWKAGYDAMDRYRADAEKELQNAILSERTKQEKGRDEAVLAERARVQALDACDEKIRAAFIFERARVNGWWRWYFQGEWTGAKADQRDAGIASGAPAPKGTP